jgi:cytochrome c2
MTTVPPAGTRPLALLALLALCLCAGGCASRGRAVFESQGCTFCHRFRGAGSELGPNLDGVGGRLDAAAIEAQITAPTSRNPASRMPAFPGIPWFDLRSLVAYLRS